MSGAAQRILAFMRKEFLHIIHDYRTLFILILLPVVQLVMFGYALNLEIQKVSLAVIDEAHSPASRHLIEQFQGSRFFRPFPLRGMPSQIDMVFKQRRARAAMIIPSDFDWRLQREQSIPVQFIIDASDANAATLIKNYCQQVLTAYNRSRGNQEPLPYEFTSTIFFNPDLKSSYFFVPGLIAMLLIMISSLLTSITIAREKESGTLEQILVSPLRSWEIITGKVLPYILLAFLDGALILFIGSTLFRVPFVGSLALLLILSILYIITALSLGLLISTIAPTQQVAMMLAITATVLPTTMLSGLIFPIASMPKLLQYFTLLVPARFFLPIVRGITLKGSSLGQLLAPVGALILMAALLLGISVRRFKLNLEQ